MFLREVRRFGGASLSVTSRRSYTGAFLEQCRRTFCWHVSHSFTDSTCQTHTWESVSDGNTIFLSASPKKSRMSAAWCDHYVNIYLQRASLRSDLTSLSGGPGAERLEGIRISSGQSENVLNGSEKSADAARMNFKCVMGGLITKTEQSEWVSRVRFDQIIEAGSFRGCRRSGPERNVLFIYFISSRWRFSQSKQCYIQIVFCLVN